MTLLSNDILQPSKSSQGQKSPQPDRAPPFTPLTCSHVRKPLPALPASQQTEHQQQHTACYSSLHPRCLAQFVGSITVCSEDTHLEW